ncbi:unnamed protein product [Phytomonas sp. Hart1]|nr:unnamed protein product [Phytomonas sp. Hart1]|eukprot:CCW66808.1 unnamed protein product [Phytomonas sp. isolate Hart1]
MRRSATIWQKKSWFDRTAIRRMVKGPVGYGPFSKTVKASSELAKGARREGEDPAGRESRTGDDASVMRNIQLRTNLHLRLSLASLVHPTQLETTPYQSPEWRMAIVRMYRVILRLHNKTVAVSLGGGKQRRRGPPKGR